ncbi:hypothetical protein [Hydrococcus rivularis]|nr:hypothetical protein [Hydrococcus rivularis]
MAAMQGINAEKSLEEFIEKDLPLLVKPHCNDTIKILTNAIESYHISFKDVLARNPVFLEWVKQRIYLYFASHIKNLDPTNNEEFYACYGAIALQYQREYIYSFTEVQLQNLMNNLDDLKGIHSTTAKVK